MTHIKDILGYKKEVEKLNSVCDFLKNTEKYIDFCVELPHCLLIYGERGVGKTLMAESLTTDCERDIFYVDVRNSAVKKIKKIFKMARATANSIVLIDDIDYLDKEDDSEIYWQIANELDRCKKGDVFVVITADDKKYLPDYLLNEFDSDMMIGLNPPKIEEACEIFKPIFDVRKLSKDFD